MCGFKFKFEFICLEFELELELERKRNRKRKKTQNPKPKPFRKPKPAQQLIQFGPETSTAARSSFFLRGPTPLHSGPKPGQLNPVAHRFLLPSPRAFPAPAQLGRVLQPARSHIAPACPASASSIARLLSLPRWAHTPAPSSPLAQRPQPSRRDRRRTLRPGPARRDPGFPFKPPHGGPCDPSPPLQPPQTLAAAALRTQSRAERCTAAGRPLHCLLAPANHRISSAMAPENFLRPLHRP